MSAQEKPEHESQPLEDTGFAKLLRERCPLVIGLILLIGLLAGAAGVLLSKSESASAPAAQISASSTPCQIRLLLEEGDGRQWMKIEPKGNEPARIEFENPVKILQVETEHCGT
jgi:hypothetical protein